MSKNIGESVRKLREHIIGLGLEHGKYHFWLKDKKDDEDKKIDKGHKFYGIAFPVQLEDWRLDVKTERFVKGIASEIKKKYAHKPADVEYERLQQRDDAGEILNESHAISITPWDDEIQRSELESLLIELINGLVGEVKNYKMRH